MILKQENAIGSLWKLYHLGKSMVSTKCPSVTTIAIYYLLIGLLSAYSMQLYYKRG